MLKKSVIAHVNQAVVAFNRKNGTSIPHITVKIPGIKGARYCSVVEWDGQGRLRDSAAEGCKPLTCGARTWLEFDGKVTLINEMTWPQIQAAMEEAKGDISIIHKDLEI